MVINATAIALLTILVFIIVMIIRLLKIKNKTNLHRHFIYFIILFTLPLIALSLQIIFSKTDIPPIYFDYATYIFTVFAPVELLAIAIYFYNPNAKIDNIKYVYLVPIFEVLMLWTNDYHHLFYQSYSTNFDESIVGPIYLLTTIYGYGLLAIDMVIMLRASIKRSGFLSKQFMLILFGILAPLIGNMLAVFKIIPATIYMTPLLFFITAICFSLAIIRYKALNITPIAFKTVINTMSDAFLVISDDGTMVDWNETFKKKFGTLFDLNKKDNFFSIIENVNILDVKELKNNIIRTRQKGEIVTKEYQIDLMSTKKYFEIDIHPVKAARKKSEYVGTLLLFKDITQHKLDMKELKEKQEIIVKQGQLVSIGELAGGVAHDINTPISAIKTGIIMLNSMTNERTSEEQELLQRMDNCATKIINIVNSMRNQIRNLGGDTLVKFKISDVINDIKIITYHEVAKNRSEVEMEIIDDVSIMGDPTKLGQVLTNLVVNAAQAYDAKGGKIKIIVRKSKYNALIEVIDFAKGIDPTIAPYVFKNILTTKGTSGTGLGLYLTYSVIKGEFNGEITFDTKEGEGTTFHIAIPLA